MLIKWIRLRNIRSYLSEEIHFPEGSTLLSGDIGAGKSTILLAIEFALFGFSTDVSGETLLRNGKPSGSVELCFDVDSKNVIIKRNLKRGKESFSQASGYVIVNNVKTEKSAEELKAFSLSLLGYPEEYLKKKSMPLYRYTVYTPQEEMKRILFESREERLNSLRKIFGIEKYGVIRANAVIVASSLREKMRELSSRIEDLARKKEELEETMKEISGTQERIGKMKPELAALSEKKQGLSKKLEILEEKRKRAAGLKSAISSYESAIAEKAELCESRRSAIEAISRKISVFTKKLEEIPAAEKADEGKLENELESISRELSLKEKSLAEAKEKERMLLLRKKEIEKEIAEEDALKNQLSLREKELEELASGKPGEEIEREREEKEKALREIIENKGRASLSKEESERVIAEIAKHKVCPLCKQEIKEDYKEHLKEEEEKKKKSNRELIESLSKEQQELESGIKILKEESKRSSERDARSNKLSAETDSIKKLLSEVEKKKTLLKGIGKEIAQMPKADAEREIGALKEKEAEQKKILKQARERNAGIALREAVSAQLSRERELLTSAEKEAAEADKAVSELNKRKIEASGELKELESTDKQWEDAKSELDSAMKREKDIEVLSAALESEASLKSRNAGKIEAEIKEKSKDKKRFELYRELEQMISDKFTALVSEMEKQVMSSIHYEFGKLFQEWFSSLIEEETMSARIDEDFTPIITEDGHDTSAENLSGGEKTAVALAYRLALNRVINDMVSTIQTKNLIILDEPTDGFSSEQLDRVRTVLDELGLRQMIIVSHEAKIESFVEHVIRITKQEHESRVLN